MSGGCVHEIIPLECREIFNDDDKSNVAGESGNNDADAASHWEYLCSAKLLIETKNILLGLASIDSRDSLALGKETKTERKI